MRIALLSNVTVEVLAESLKKRHEVWIPSGFAAWMSAALAPDAQMLAFAPEAVFLLLDRSHSSFDEGEAASAKSSLVARFPDAVISIVDLEDLANETAGFFDERMWQIASMPWSYDGLNAIEREIDRLAEMIAHGERKVLAIDFDNTLWNGVVGEDGTDGVEPFAEFQSGIKSLKDSGVLLAGLSRNNSQDVEPLWSDSRMILKKEDFAYLGIGWCEKSDSLEECANILNLPTDSFVFVDDNPVERERMKAVHPEVAVPDFPISARRLRRLYFPRLRTTAEDLKRTELYHAESQRRGFGAGLTLDDYLERLEIKTEIHPIAADEIPRIAQLCAKTNQFNVCTNRHSQSAIRRFAADASRIILTMHSSDRFGDLGLVAFVHARIAGAAAEIVDWVMSCRAMNRRIEFALEEALETTLRNRGVAVLKARWLLTDKNAPVRELFDRFGFDCESKTIEVRTYRKEL